MISTENPINIARDSVECTLNGSMFGALVGACVGAEVGALDGAALDSVGSILGTFNF